MRLRFLCSFSLFFLTISILGRPHGLSSCQELFHLFVITLSNRLLLTWTSYHQRCAFRRLVRFLYAWFEPRRVQKSWFCHDSGASNRCFIKFWSVRLEIEKAYPQSDILAVSKLQRFLVYRNEFSTVSGILSLQKLCYHLSFFVSSFEFLVRFDCAKFEWVICWSIWANLGFSHLSRWVMWFVF